MELKENNGMNDCLIISTDKPGKRILGIVEIWASGFSDGLKFNPSWYINRLNKIKIDTNGWGIMVYKRF